MLNENEILRLWEKAGAFVRDSHIIYTSGKHGKHYVNKDALYPHTALASQLCEELALRVANVPVDAVLAPATGGIVLSQWLAHHLSRLWQREVIAVYAEKSEDSFVIKRGYDALIRDKKVLVVEDILTTGGSVLKVVEAVRKIPSEVVGVVALCNRGKVTAKMLGEVPFLTSLFSVHFETWDEKDCPLCRAHVPINTDVGKGREFLRSHSTKRDA